MSESEWKVSKVEEGHRGLFELTKDGDAVGKMTFSRLSPTEIIVDHTETDDSIRGQGGGKRLFDGLVAWARDSGTSIRATCPFALAMFERHPETQDVLAK
ncbi:MAG: N-acetyltransferase [Deltaproteobacteria bacterium]|nr:N-acetyltransferase [Deltaproteobacteria bacterium]